MVVELIRHKIILSGGVPLSPSIEKSYPVQCIDAGIPSLVVAIDAERDQRSEVVKMAECAQCTIGHKADTFFMFTSGRFAVISWCNSVHFVITDP